MAELRNWNPSLRDRIAYAISGGAGKLGANNQRQQWVADKARGLLDFVPGVGEAVGLDDAWNDYQSGNYGMAATGLGLTAMGALPGAGDAAAALLKRSDFESAIRKAREIYDYVGIRTVPDPVDPSNLRSRVWVDGEPTSEFLDGLSVTDARSAKWGAQHGFDARDWSTGYYPGDYTYIIGGHNAQRGEDIGELIITDPEVFMGGKR